MDRYSTIIGTIASGAETRLEESAGLADFLQRQGSLDVNSVLQVVHTQLRGFESLAGYEAEMQNQKPVAVRYAPMHLYKLRGMERMHPFCALAVNGVENREDRISRYSQTFVFSHQQALQGMDGYNYLDMLFGTELLSWKTLEQYRNGQAPLEADLPLRKVTPRIEVRDLITALKTVEAIYQKKNVVLRLEPNHSFNDRAISLLAGIYSLLQPHLAVEVGYATYQRAADIAKIVERNSIRIFVLPAGESLDQIPDSFLILDLAKPPAPLQKTSLMETLVKWVQLPWEQRQSAMQNLFMEERDYQDPELFVQKSTEFFSALRSVDLWNRDPSKNGTISSIEELYKEYEGQSGYNVPWFDQMFREKIAALIGKQSNLDKLNAQTAVKLLTTTGEEQQHARTMYQFGRKFGNVDVGELCQLIINNQDSIWQVKIEQIEADHAQKMAAEQENTRKAIADGKAAVDAAKAIAAEELAQEKENARIAIEAEQANTRQAVADGKAAVIAANAIAAEKLAQEKENARIAVEAERANTQKAVKDGEAAVAAEQEKYTALQKEKTELRAKAIAALNEEKARTKEVSDALEQEREHHRQTKEAARNLSEQHKSLQENLRREQEKTSDLHQALNNTRQERDAARAKISKAESASLQAIEDRNAMQKEQEAALAAAEHAKQELKNYKRGKYNLRLLATGGVAGLLAGTLLIGAIWLCTSLLGRNKELPAPAAETVMITEETAPIETTAETQAPTVETVPATTEPETQPATVETDPAEAATEENDTPVMVSPIDATALSALPEQVPALKTVQMEDLEGWMPEALSQEDQYRVLALLTTAEAVPETTDDTTAFSYALLVERNDTAEDPSEAADELSADLQLLAEPYALLVFGDDSMQHAAIQAFASLISEEIPVSVQLGGDGAPDLNVLAAEALGDANWWRILDSYSLQAPEADTAALPADVEQQPVLYLCCGGQWVFVYDCTEDLSLAENLLALTETYSAVQHGNFVALAVK